jgi:hypothetical protein
MSRSADALVKEAGFTGAVGSSFVFFFRSYDTSWTSCCLLPVDSWFFALGSLHIYVPCIVKESLEALLSDLLRSRSLQQGRSGNSSKRENQQGTSCQNDTFLRLLCDNLFQLRGKSFACSDLVRWQ